MYKGFNYKGRRRERKQGSSFPFLVILRGKVHIYWFKPITNKKGENLGIWICGRLALLPSSLLKADHSIERAICLIR